MVNIKKLESTQKLLIETREKILSDKDSWNDYVLNAVVKFYKYSYADQILIHAQRRDATACAEYHMWNDIFKRYVKRNSKGIALLLPGGDGSQRLRYVFDVSDTGGMDKVPELWSYKDDYEDIVKTALCEVFNKDNGYPLLGLISSVAASDAFNWLSDRNYLGSNTLRHLIARNAEVVVQERLGLRGTWMPEYNGINALNDAEKELLLKGINHVAGRILRTIERTIKLHERSLNYGEVIRGDVGRVRDGARRPGRDSAGNDTNWSAGGRGSGQGNAGLLRGERDNVPAGGRLLRPGSSSGRGDTGENRPLRESASEVPSGEPTGRREPDDTRREYKRDSGTAERGSGEQGTRAYNGIGKEESRPEQDDAPAGMGGSHEHAQGAGDRNSDERDDLRLGGGDMPGGGIASAWAPKRRRRKDNSKQLSLFPSEEEQRAAIEAQNREATSNSKPIITDEFIDDLLRVGPMWVGGKERILNFFSAHLDAPVEEKARFLSGLYDGSSFDIDTADEEDALGDAKFNENGIEIFLRYVDIPDKEIFISWNDAAQRIEKIIQEGNYLINGPEGIWNGAEIKITEEDIDRMAAAGTGFTGGRRRIANIFASHNSEITEELVNQLREEYRDTTRQSVRLTPDGGRETLHSVAFFSSCIGYQKTLMRIGDLREKRANLGCHVSISWREMAERIGRLLSEGKYLTDADKAMSEEEVAAGNKISREDIESVFLSQPLETRMQNYKILLDEEKYGLKKETGKTIEYSGYSYDFPDGFDGMVTFESGKRRIQKGHIEVVLSKAKAKAVIKQLIRDGRYISPEEMQEIEDREEANRLGELEFARPGKEEVENSAQTDAETSPFEAEIVEASNSPEAKANYRITDDRLGVGTPKERYANNIAAIKLLKELEVSGRMASAEEQDVLAKYVGWGGLAGAFDEDDSGWSREYLELKELLTEEEYRSARASTLTAYYTPPIVTQAIYSTLERMGFTGGNVLEPAMGTGHFFGTMPEEIRNNSRLYGVELDSLTGRIAAQLYQRANIKVCGYEETSYQDNFFDVAVGNVPFGQYKVADSRYNKLNYSVHDYYFAKTLDKVRPGGVVAFVTSRYTMDKENPSVRRYIAQRAELLGAVRLPNTTFKDAAGTEVVSDILFLQKRERVMDVEPEWIYTGKTDDGIVTNEYFIKHPEMVCGKLELTSSAYGPTPTCSPIEGKGLGDMLAEAMSHIEGRFAPVSITLDEDEKEPFETIPADPNVRNYSYAVVNGEIYYRENAVMYKPEKAVGTRAERIKGLIALRDCTRELIDYQLNGYSDEDIAAKQRELRQLYDGYIAKYGIINSRGNAQAFEADSGYFLLCSLEELDAEGNLKGLADMFSARTIGYKAVPDRVETAVEALAVSISERAGVDLPYMSSLLGGKAEDEIVRELDGVIYENPLETTKNGGKAVYETADAYLSGDILQKIHIAEVAEKGNPGKYQKNIEALQKVMPERLSASEITVRLGTSWIEPRFIKDFIVELLEPTPYFANNTLDITYVQMNAEWRIQGKRSDKFNIRANETYGTAFANAYDLIEEALNGKTPKIYKTVIGPDGNERKELDAKETAAAVQKQEIIKDEFKDWIFYDLERREYLVDKYNRLFNNIRPREYDGSHIAFSGMNPEMKLEKHQRDAAARILYGPNTLLAHVVGAGKTFEMVASAMESKRLGLCHKSMFVVPNHLTEQTAAEFLKLYPAANILVATRKDFEKKNRKTFCSRIATGDYDAVILGYSQMEKIPVSLERQCRFLEEQIDQIMAGIEELKRTQGERFSVKRYEQQQIKLQEKMEILQQRMNDRKDDVITFEELGVDRLYVDEAHNYKNLMTYTKMSNVAGISTTEAQKSADLHMKCRYMDEITGGRGIVFATGTPVSNSMVELYTMQRYLQMGELEKRGLTHFDAWASSFGETVNVLELAPEGSGYRMRTRFAKFYNLPELMRMFSECADIKTADMLNLPVPTAHYETVAVMPTETQLEMIQELSKRAEKVRNRIVRPDEDNMLSITNDGRKIGLDQRLMDYRLPDAPGSKVNACIGNVLRIWNETKEERGTQLIFCDFSTPGKGFNLYDDIRGKLERAGVPSEEIAYIHDADTEAKKAALFAKVREGRVRVLMGSTQKMGAGTNVQDRLVASHDLDCPWRPADLEQRAGRIVRQGNRNKDVYIYRYVTERTFDAYLYQTVENKQKFISQIMTSRSPLRSCEDMDESVLQYAEIKALCSGNPKIKEKMDLDVQVGRLNLLKAAYNDNRYRLEQSVAKSLPERIAFLKGIVKGLEDDIAHIEANTHEDNDAHFSPMKIMQTLCTEKKSAGAKILMAREMKSLNAYTPIGEYRGMPMYIGSVGYIGGAQADVLRFQREGGPKTEVELGDDAIGNIARINNAFAKLPDRLELAKTQLAQCEKQLTDYAEKLRKPFEHADELEKLQARLNVLNAELSLDRPQTKQEAEQERQEDIQDNLEDRVPLESEGVSGNIEPDLPLQDKPEKIEDFGEKIGGARKDIYAYKREIEASNTLTDDEIAVKPLSEVIPAPRYDKLLKDGTAPEAVAMIRAIRESLPEKPKNAESYKKAVYAQSVKAAKGLIAQILDDDGFALSLVHEHNGDEFVDKVIKKAELYLALGHDVSLADCNIRQGTFTVVRGEKLPNPERLWVIESKKLRTIGYGELYDDAVDDFKREMANRERQDKPKSATKFDAYYYKRNRDEVFVGKKVGREYIKLAGPFENGKEAGRYIREHRDELEARWQAYKSIPYERRSVNDPRAGSDRRGGKSVTPEMFMEAFGFRGVEFGNYVDQDKRQLDLNEAYDALIDLADVINVPPKALSLNGQLGLAFGARGKGGKNAPKAHYEPFYTVINLTKSQGAGSLAHEWMHAVDNFFGNKQGKSTMMSDSGATMCAAVSMEKKIQLLGDVRPEMADAFGGVFNAVRRETELEKRSKLLDKRRAGKPYWGTMPEMQARAFEAYVIERLAERGIRNDYLANVVSEEQWKERSAERGPDLPNDYPYPTKEEMSVVREAFDKFFEMVKMRETEKGIEMYSLGQKSRGSVLPPVSIDDVKARVKGAEIIDHGQGKWTLKFVNGLQWIVDTMADRIPIDPDVVARDYGREVRPEDVVSGRTRIFDGQSFIDLVSGMSDAATFSHECFETTWEMLNADEQTTLLNAYKTREMAADRYAAFLEGRVSSSSSAVGAVFQRVKDFFMDIRASLFGRNSEDIFRQIAQGKVYERPVLDQEISERYKINTEIVEKGDELAKRMEVEEIIDKPVAEWTNEDADKVLNVIDAGIAADKRTRDHKLRVDLENAAPGEKGKVIEAYEREFETKKGDAKLLKKYLSKLQEWQEFKDMGAKEVDKMAEKHELEDLMWITVEGGASKEEMASLFDAIAHKQWDCAKKMVAEKPALLFAKAQDPYYTEKKYWDGAEESTLPLYTPAEYAHECRFTTLEEYFKEREKEHESLKKHVGLDTSQRFTLSVDREKGIYTGKILAISEDGSTITQQMGKGIVELDHRAENFPKEKLAGLRPGQTVTICYRSGRGNIRVREEAELER